MVKIFFFVLQEVAVSTLEYLTDLLYNGFYCFEAISTRNLDDGICGICGVVGEVYLGDGNEKNCCSRKEVNVFSCCELFKLMVVINFFLAGYNLFLLFKHCRLDNVHSKYNVVILRQKYSVQKNTQPLTTSIILKPMSFI